MIKEINIMTRNLMIRSSNVLIEESRFIKASKKNITRCIIPSVHKRNGASI